MPIFPLAKKVDSYKTVAPCKFDYPRGGGTRKHAGCDLGIGAGSAVFAIADGTVIEASNTGFLVKEGEYNVGVISVKHDISIKIGEAEHSSFVVRYGEVDTVKFSVNATVKEGDQIASVAKQGKEGTQLHLELYLGEQGITASSKFKADKKPYMRAFTPSDPAAFLDGLSVK